MNINETQFAKAPGKKFEAIYASLAHNLKLHKFYFFVAKLVIKI